MDDPSDPAFTEMGDEVLRVYKCAPVSEETLTTPSKVPLATAGFKVGKAPG
jgi:hypothetical protein